MVSTKSIVFDGVDDYIDFGDVSTFQKDYTDAFSMSCWAKTVATAPISTLMGKMNGTIIGQPGYLMFLNASGQFEAVLRNTVATNSLRVRTVESRYNDGGWHHFAMTYDGADILLYVDGVVKATTTVYSTLSSSILASGKSFQAGAYDANTLPFAGHIDEVAFFEDELSASEVLAVFASARPADLTGSRALVGWWQMGENASFPTVVDRVTGVVTFPTIPDDSINSNDGTMTNMVAGDIVPWVPWSNFSQYSYYFDGVSEYITMGDVLNYERTDVFSISGWFKSTVSSNSSLVAKQGNTNPEGWGVELTGSSGGGLRLSMTHTWVTDCIVVDTVETGFNDGEWHHLVMVFDGVTYPSSSNAVSFYVDGSLLTNSVVYNTLTSNIATSFDLTLARRVHTSSPLYFSGYLTDVAIYDAALDLTDAQWIYNSGTPRDLRLPAAPSDLAAYWRIGEAGECPQSSWNHKVGQWKWDAAATKESTTITDASQLNSPGTLYNMDASNVTTDTPGGISSYSCTFNGVDEGMYCNVATTVSGAYYFAKRGSLATSGWVKTTATDGFLWGTPWTGGANPFGYIARISGGKPYFFHGSAEGFWGSARTGDNTINDGAWHHVLCTIGWTSGLNWTINIYVDGVLQPTTVTLNTNSSSIGNAAFSIGAIGAGTTSPFAGQIDEVSVWSKFFSQDDVDEVYGAGVPNDLRDLSIVGWLRGWWRMGDAYPYPGTTVNMDVADKIPTAPGSPNYTKRSLKFATSDYVIVPNAPEIDFDYDETFSISSWVFPLGVNAYSSIWYKKSGVGLSIAFYGGSGGATYDPRGLIRIIFDGTTGFFQVYPSAFNSTTLPFGEWFHFVMTYDGSNDASGVKIYINGKEMPVFIYINTPFGGGDTMKNSGDVWLGREASYWVGNQDDVSAWDKELTQADVTELYNGGDPADLSTHTSVANLVGWWRMGEGPGNDGTMINMAPTDIIENAPRYPKTAASKIDYFLMRGIDSACGPLTYHHWTVTGSPDFAGAQAGTLPCGGPLTDITVAASWSVYN